MGRLLAMSICLSLALGCGGEKKKKEEAPAKTPPKQEVPADPPPAVPGELELTFAPSEDPNAPFDQMQDTVRSADAELRGCFTGTKATKANVGIIVVAKTGAVESVSPSADRELAEECLKKVLGPLQFPTWAGDKVVLNIKFAMVNKP